MTPFENPFALLALLSIIPLIILYLLRPKPRTIKVPSLMFLMRVQKEKKRFYSSFTRFIKDPLFWVQLFILIFLSLAAANPYFTTDEPLSQEHTVIIIDSSASMQTDNRFDDAVSIAGDHISRTNTIILASNIPSVQTSQASATDARRILGQIEPHDTVADISSAINSGLRDISQYGGRIVVISDFANWDGEDPVVTKNLVESYGIEVEFINVGQSSDNTGFINGWIDTAADGYTYTGVIKNYNNYQETLTISIFSGNTDTPSQTTQLTVPARQTRQLAISNLSPGVTRVEIENRDSLMVDNIAYISIPGSAEQNVLLVSDKERLPSRTAISLIPNVRLSASESVPSSIGSYDIVVLANKEKVLSESEINTLDDFVNGGGSAVFIASDIIGQDVVSTDLLRLLPVRIEETIQAPSGVSVDKTVNSRLTDDIKFNEIGVYGYIKTSPRSGATVLAQTRDQVPMYAHHPVGEGTVAYIGFNDEIGNSPWNNFHNLPEYPVFWSKLIRWMGGTGSIDDYNVKTGTTLSLKERQTIHTPYGVIEDNRIQVEKAGIYEIGNRKIAANLYSEPESDTTSDGSDVMDRITDERTEPGLVRDMTFTVRNYLDNYLIALVLLLLALEIYIIKRRGEL